MDRRIEVYGTTRQDVNGKRGVATDFTPLFSSRSGVRGIDLSQSRYTILLDSGEAVKARAAHVRAEPPAAARGASTKAKGSKGKKGGGAGRK